MCSGKKDFEYEPLHDHSSRIIRLMTLLPGSNEDQITCTLLHVPQSESLEYAAVSYAWGTSEPDCVIFINDCVHRVKPNLHLCLRSLRHEQHALQLWVDAICINQRDNDERGHQVRLMGEIYKNASRVYVFLGDDTHDVAASIARSNNSWDVLNELKYSCASPRRIYRGLRSFLTQSAGRASILNRDVWACVADLCSRKYWSRAWIVTELLLAAQPIICVGRVQITWHDFCDLINACADSQGRFLPQHSSNHHIRRVQIFMFTKNARSRLLPLATIMNRYYRQECLDPRDHAYAYLSVASDCNDIVPSYEQDALDLFFQLKNTVRNHTLLRYTLEISLEDVKARAELLGIEVFRHPRFLIVRCLDENDNDWHERKLMAERKSVGFGDFSYWSSSDYLASPQTEFPYKARAVYDFLSLTNRSGAHEYDEAFAGREGDILSVANPFDEESLAKNSRGQVGWVDASGFVLLEEGF